MRTIRILLLMMLSLLETANASENISTMILKDRVCPDGWGASTVEIDLGSPSEPVAVPWVSNGDKSDAKDRLRNFEGVHSLDKLWVSPNDLVNDPLTVASECLKYRNLIADGVKSVEQPADRVPLYYWFPAIM